MEFEIWNRQLLLAEWPGVHALRACQEIRSHVEAEDQHHEWEPTTSGEAEGPLC